MSALTFRAPRAMFTVASRRRLAAFFFLLPALAVLTSLFAFPLARLVRLSFQSDSGSFTLAHYSDLLTDTTYLRIFWTTFQLAVIVTVLCLLLGYPVAYALVHARPRTARWMMLPLVVALSLSILARTYAWIVLLQRHGVVNGTLVALGVIDQPLSLVYNRLGVYVGMVHILLPFMVMALLPVLRGIDPTLPRAAQSLGARPSLAFLRVYLPLSLPGVIAGSTLVFVIALGFFITPAVLGGGRTTTIAMVVQQQVQQLIDFKLAATTSMALLAISLVALLVYERFADVDRIFGRTR